MGFGSPPAPPATDLELARDAERALGVLSQRIGARQEGRATQVAAWLEVAQEAARRVREGVTPPPPDPRKMPGQTELGDFLPTPAPGAVSAAAEQVATLPV